MSTGMAWDQVLDQLDLPALDAFTRYWKRHPPLHLMVAAYLDAGEKPREDAAEVNPLQILQAAFPQGQR